MHDNDSGGVKGKFFKNGVIYENVPSCFLLGGIAFGKLDITCSFLNLTCLQIA